MKTLPKSSASEGLRVFPHISLYLFFILFFQSSIFSEKPSNHQKGEIKVKNKERYELKPTIINPRKPADKPSAFGRTEPRHG